LLKKVLDQLKQENFSIKSNSALASKFIPGLRPFEIGANGSESAAKEIQSRFSTPAMQAPFYGKCLFDNWLLLGDLKADTLQIAPGGKPVFLDASMAFNGDEWREECLAWKPLQFKKGSVYLERVVSDGAQFEPWLRIVRSVNMSLVNQILGTVPADWPVPQSFAAATGIFLSKTQAEFLPAFRDWAENWIV
jgi:hypothetical protein